MDSLDQFGQQIPLVIRKGIVLKGNGTLEAAKRLKWSHLAVVEFKAADNKLAVAFSLADNRSAELAEWAFESLAGHFKGLQAGGFDLSKIGWEPFEFEPLLQADWTPPKIDEDGTSLTGAHLLKFSDDEYKSIASAIARFKKQNPKTDLSDSGIVASVCKSYAK